MAHSNLTFVSPTFGTLKQAPVGFSWTVLFFGFWPAVFRGDAKWALIIFASEVVAGAITFGFGIIVPCIIFGVIYNKLYIKDLVNKGYQVKEIQSQRTAEQLAAEMETSLPPYEGPHQKADQGTKKCSFCAELIRSDAIKCKHCGSDLVASS